MGQTYATIDTATQTGADVFGHLADRTDTLLTSFSGSSSPGTPSQGQLWLDTSAASYVLKVYADLDATGAAWYEVGTVLHGTVDGNNNQLANVRLENLTSHTTPSAGVIGEVYIHTTEEKASIIVSATEREVLMSANNTDYIATWLPAAVWENDATNPPTAVTVGTSPVVRGKLFDATNERASVSVVVPSGYSGDSDCILRCYAYLNAAETASDTIDAVVDLVSVQPDNDEVPTGTSTQYTRSESISTQNTQYALHKFDVTLTYNDATNPISAGDLIEIEFGLSSVASVAGIIFRGAQFLAPFGSKVTE